MSNKKATKRALLTSITALAMCVVMLVGTTFAWFTDTATANVNKIQAGNLNVALEMLDGTNWVTAEGQTLNFVKAAGGESQAILWEPGAEYKLPELRVRNDGNLALKYEVAITGAVDATPNNGVNDLELLDVITFSASIGGGTATSGVYGKTIATGALNKNGDFQTIQLSAKMDENAGNKYQEMAISGIAITVKAMQTSYEYDSNGNTYDRDANGNPDNPTWSISANVTAPVVSGGATVISNADKTAVATVPEAAAKDSSGELTLKVVADDSAAASVSVNSAQAALGYEVEVVGLDTTNTAPVKVELKVGAGLTNVVLYHNGNPMTKGTSADSLTDGQYFYNESTGILTFATSTFSPFAVVYDAPTAVIGDTYYDTLADAVAAAKDDDTITLLKNTNGNGIQVATGKFATRGLTVNFNGHSYTVGGVLVGSSGTGTNAFQLLQGNKITFKNGSIVGVAEGTKPAEDTPDWHGAPAIMIQNYCDLTLDNMIVTGGDQTVYTMSNNNGNVVIKDTTINKGGAKGYGYGPYAFDVCRYSSYPSVNVTVTGNSVINGDVEISGTIGNGQSRQLTINSGKFYGKFKVANEPANITINGGEFVDLTNAVKYAADGATIKLLADVEQNSMLSITKSVTLDLNGKTIYNTKDIWDVSGNALISVEDDANVTLTGNGAVKAKQDDCYTLSVNKGTLTIENGEYVGNVSAVQVNVGQLNIKGGKFSQIQEGYGDKYLINCIDANWKNGTAKISITGGEFKGSDMSASTSENPAAKFVADGYKSVQEGDWFKVVAK
ncbi:MAG: hypothetical protein EGQ40_04895 [Clostridiales bacterium]|nr:hypothetical protein [Clostridiales bacterium]